MSPKLREENQPPRMAEKKKEKERLRIRKKWRKGGRKKIAKEN